MYTDVDKQGGGIVEFANKADQVKTSIKVSKSSIRLPIELALRGSSCWNFRRTTNDVAVAGAPFPCLRSSVSQRECPLSESIYQNSLDAILECRSLPYPSSTTRSLRIPLTNATCESRSPGISSRMRTANVPAPRSAIAPGIVHAAAAG